jgi:type IV pilus assembly protein PilA
MKKHSHATGFSLIELLIVIAIAGILIAILVPSYQTYTRRAHYSEVVQAAAPYKIGVEQCYQMMGALDSCTADQNGVPANITQGSGLVSSITVNDTGQITAIPKELYGITAEDTYILTPRIENDAVIWDVSGGGPSRGYV